MPRPLLAAMRRLVAAPLALGFALAASAQEGVRWEGDLARALEEARASRKPVFVAINMDEEEANDEAARVLYRDPRIVARSRELVCLVASAFEHATAKAGERDVCARFGTVTCAEHRQVEKDVRRVFLDGRSVVNTPQHLFASPDGALLARREWKIPARPLLAMMERALQESGRDVPRSTEPPRERERPGEPAFDEAAWAGRLKGAEPEKRQALRDLVRLDSPEAHSFLESRYAAAGADDERIEMLRAMGEPGYGRAVPFLVKVAAGRDRTLRRHAIVSLEIVGDAQALAPLLKAAKAEADESVLKELLRAIAKLGPGDREVADLVLKKTADSDDLVRGNALVACADLADGKRAREAARKALGDRSSDVRGCAVFALGNVGDRDDLARLAAMEEKEADFRVRMMIGVARALLEREGRVRPREEYRIGLLHFAHDDIPHDGTWPAPRAGRFGR